MTSWLVTLLQIAMGPGAWGQTPVPPGDHLAARQSGVVMRWENIEGSPFWLDGAAPRFSAIEGIHLVRLLPGTQTRLILDGSTTLKVVMPGERPGREDLVVWCSDGLGIESRLDAELEPGEEALFYCPRQPGAVLLRLARPLGAETPRDLALFLLRAEAPSELSGFRELVAPSAPPGLQSILVRSDRPFSSEQLWRGDGRAVSLPVPGPAEIAVVTRFVYAPGERSQRQAYEIEAVVDGLRRRFRLETSADTRTRRWIGSSPTTLGLERTIRFEVGPGSHLVELWIPPGILHRTLRRAADDFLLHTPPARERDAGAATGIAARIDMSTLPGNELEVAMRCREVLASLTASPAMRSESGCLFRRLTQYRALGPLAGPGEGRQLAGWLAPPRLLSPGEALADLYLDEGLVDDALEGFSLGIFHEAPPTIEQAHVYDLPPRRSDSLLRLSVLREAPWSAAESRPFEICVELEGSRLVRLRCDPAAAAPGSRLQPSVAEAALTIASSADGPWIDPGSLARLAAAKTPLPILAAWCLEIDLPRDVPAIRVWCPDVHPAPRVAVQILEGAAYRLTESEYLEAWKAASERLPGTDLLRAGQDLWRRGERPRDPSLALLVVHWTPLFRFLRAAADRFAAAAAAPAPLDGNAAMLIDEITSQERVAEAHRLESEGEWLLAFEAWSREAAGGDPSIAPLARLRQAGALLELGERFLGQLLLRGIYHRGSDGPLWREARDRLLETYRLGDERDNLIALVATELERGADAGLLRLLAETLVDDGEHFFGLSLALALPEAERPAAAVARAAARLRWWRAHEAAAVRLPDLERATWSAWRAAQRGSFDEALAILQALGPRTASVTRRLRESLEVRELLRSPSPELRRQAIARWENALTSSGGAEAWEDDPGLIVDHAGLQLVRSTQRELVIHYARSLPERPVRLRVVGPARLQVEARPVHVQDGVGPINDWLFVKWGGALQPLPISGNLPAGQLELINSPTRFAGTSVVGELRFPEGLHQVEVLSRTHELLVRVKVAREEVPLGAMPPLNGWTAACLVHAAERSRDVRSDYDVTIMSGRGALQRPGTRARSFALGAQQAVAWTAEAEAWLESRMGGPGSGQPNRRGAPELLWQGNHAGALAASWEESESGLRQRMACLLYVAEHDLYLAREARALGESLFRAHPGVPGLQSMLGRLVAGTEWRRVTAVRESSGVRTVKATAWSPASADLRIRSALLPPLAAHERLLVADGVLGFALDCAAPTQLKVDLTLLTLEHLPALDLNVRCQIDLGETIDAVLSRVDGLPQASSVSMFLTVPPGEHALRFWADPPIVNHFVRIGCSELVRDGGELVPRPIPAASSRTYFVATPEQPVVLAVEGPTTLQVHELRDGLVRSHNRFVPPGWQEIRLEAPAGRQEGLFRAFERVASTDRRAAALPGRPEPAGITLEPVGPLAMEPIPMPAESVVFVDRGIEDGTVSLDATVRRRRVFEEDDAGGDDTVHFFELGAEHRYFAPALSAYFASRLLGRLFEKTGPTLGATEDIVFRLDGAPAVLRLTGTAYMQWPEGDTWSTAGEIQWSTSLRGAAYRTFPLGTMAYHTPSLALFGRILSLDKLGGLESEDVDADVFTPYKAEHQLGWTVAETVGYFPWRDSQWWGRAALTSNENLNPGNPDNVSAQAGWSQFVDGWLFDLAYRYTRFFNDDDRDEAKDRHALSADVAKEVWLGPRYRLALGAQVRHDFPDDITSGFIYLSWSFSRGRGFRDHPPGDVPFRELREALIPWDAGDP